MAIHKHEAVSEESMNWQSPDNTICQTIRNAYHRIDDEQARHDLRVATSMAKSMTAKLEEYKRNWRQGFWDKNESFAFQRHNKPIDVLFLCWDDNANTMYRFWQCAKYLGLHSVMFKGKTHPFGYPNQAPIHPSLAHDPISSSPTTIMAPGIESLINSAHVVHLGASTYPMAAVDWKRINVVVQHGGTVYRQNPTACNNLFNQFANKAVIQCPDLLGLGANNESWIYYPVDTVNIKPDFSSKDNIPIIGHFPSNPKVKGTDLIELVLADLANDGYKFVYNGTTDRVPWAHNLRRMSECDIIIEGCQQEQNGKAYCEWGNTALEASALGCSVVTHHAGYEKYSTDYGAVFGPLVANSRRELYANVSSLLGDLERLDRHKRECRAWAEKYHSIPATATRLWDLVYKDFFA